MKILIASNNSHKINEIKQIVAEKISTPIEFISPKSLNLTIDPEETGKTFAENAEIKAIAFYKAAKIPVIADDSGLEVGALNGLPGVNSARFAEAHNDAANRKKLLKLLENSENRSARFYTVITFYDGEKVLFFDGECKGEIIREEKGNAGFGYDPIFVPLGGTKTFAELSEKEKNKISHRYNAIANFCDNFLKNNL